MAISKFTSKVIGDKRRWRQYKARTRQLPENYRMAVDALERYLMYFGPADGSSAAAMFEDLADLFKQAAADGTPVRDRRRGPGGVRRGVSSELPGGHWINRDRERLTNAIERVAGNES